MTNVEEKVEEVKEKAPKTFAQKDNRKPRDGRREPRKVIDDGFKTKMIDVRRVTKVVKGGRTMRFSALVVVGDGNGKVGIGTGKASEVPQAIEKATQVAKKNLKEIKIVNGTIPHESIGKFGTSNIILLPAKEGTGVIAGGSARAVLELVGIKDIVTKIHGSTNKINCVKATLNGLLSLRTREEIAARRGKNPDEI